MSFGILIVAHGTLAESLCVLLEEMLEDVRDLGAIGLENGYDIEAAQYRIRDTAEALDQGGGVAVVTDLHGSTPCNAAQLALQDSASTAVLLAGANMPMLVALAQAQSRGMPLEQAAETAVKAGQQYVQLCPIQQESSNGVSDVRSLSRDCAGSHDSTEQKPENGDA